MEGWIRVHRAITENPLWTDKPFSKGQAWIDLLLCARFKNEKLMVKGQIVEVLRGSYLTSEEKLCDRWGWSRNKVRAYLRTLADEGMIEKKGTPYGTVITIVKYEFYQNDGTAESTSDGTAQGIPESTSKGTSKGTQNKKEKKGRKERKEECKNTPLYPPNEFFEDNRLDKSFAEFVDFRRRTGMPLNLSDAEKLKNKLCSLAVSEHGVDINKAVAIIDQSIMNGWKGLFPLDRDKKPRASSQGNEWDALRQKYEGVGE